MSVNIAVVYSYSDTTEGENITYWFNIVEIYVKAWIPETKQWIRTEANVSMSVSSTPCS